MDAPIPWPDFFAALDDGYLVLDASQRVVQANPSAGRLLGLEAGALAGRPAAELAPGLGGWLRQGAQIRPLLLKKQGCVCRAFPLGGPEGEPLTVLRLRTGLDGEDRSSGGRLLSQLQAIFDHSSDGIWVTDGTGTIISINRASEQLNAIKAAQFLGKKADSVVREGLVDRSVTLEVLRVKKQISLIQHIRRTKKQLLVTGTPTFDNRGEIDLVVVNERDITELNNLRSSLERARRAQEKVQSELAELTMRELLESDIVAESPSMRKLMTMILKLAGLDASEVLLLGESGTGKGLLAKYLHQSSPRSARPFLQINCAALPANLFEAELFGYERGAFTGASESGKAGLLELAQDGTFFFDEVGEIPMDVQAKLLKCLDDREFIPLGGKEPKKVTCRIVAATNRDLDDLVARGRFRKDLYYRLNTFSVRIPPLRERQDDIFELANLYLRRFNEQYGSAKRFTHRAVDALTRYPFPGNVRELIGIMKKAVAICEDQVLDEFLEQMISGSAERVRGVRGRPSSLAAEVERVEREMLRRARAACRTTREMAVFLGISQPSVVRKLKRHGMQADDS
ncbi:putative sigma54 specific transcriptional regulator [Desulfovibrio sp. X2]|uniref:sigma 54-interacting transcriptional regulator n=1 Tax=Desulfovibrio sp. X2 TaxID=941449 RepID=UPI000358A3FD|nr:sigma 54-interacting transcriptional regulator [Desulfovibrio sp. X2]EPR44529.1 putative sigma54 specific transcriptional regulator [Desulfovibrio sp. X2]